MDNGGTVSLMAAYIDRDIVTVSIDIFGASIISISLEWIVTSIANALFILKVNLIMCILSQCFFFFSYLDIVYSVVS